MDTVFFDTLLNYLYAYQRMTNEKCQSEMFSVIISSL